MSKNSPKYKLTMAHLLEKSGIHKLERDGHTRSDIHNLLHREMQGESPKALEKVISSLYDRKE